MCFEYYRELTLEVRQTVLFDGQAVEFVVTAAVADDVMVEFLIVIVVVRETDEEFVSLVLVI